jgi:hypothetical protein
MLSCEIMTPGNVRNLGSINANLLQNLALLRITPSPAAPNAQYLLPHSKSPANDVINDDNIDVSLEI